MKIRSDISTQRPPSVRRKEITANLILRRADKRERWRRMEPLAQENDILFIYCNWLGQDYADLSPWMLQLAVVNAPNALFSKPCSLWYKLNYTISQCEDSSFINMWFWLATYIFNINSLLPVWCLFKNGWRILLCFSSSTSTSTSASSFSSLSLMISWKTK